MMTFAKTLLGVDNRRNKQKEKKGKGKKTSTKTVSKKNTVHHKHNFPAKKKLKNFSIK